MYGSKLTTFYCSDPGASLPHFIFLGKDIAENLYRCQIFSNSNSTLNLTVSLYALQIRLVLKSTYLRANNSLSLFECELYE